MSRSKDFSGALLPRYRPLLWLSWVFLGMEFLTRLALLARTGDGVPADLGSWLHIFFVGLAYDLVALIYYAWPMVLCLWLIPRRCFGSRWSGGLIAIVCASLAFALMFVGVSEWVFWTEFESRFNFIAVDYLVYSREVIGNIEASYPVTRILLALAAMAATLMFATRRGWWPQRDSRSTFVGRSLVTAVWLALTITTAVAVDGEQKNDSANEFVDELSGNGIYEFFAAYRNNELDYDRFYRTLPEAAAFQKLRALTKTPEATFVSADTHDISRTIENAGAEQHLNVVLISVESLSGELLGAFGNSKGITPYLDALADKSLFFTSLYAAGTRTVRGLEALSLSVPPTPGQSIVKRPNNENLFSLGSVFDGKGYESTFVYGGYGYFDNMNYFFSHNGYRIADRSDIPSDQVHHANIWGVADEDLYTLAMREADRAAADGKPFFEHVMTTSNHPPFTYPAGRIDLQSGKSGRAGAVKYTDWAIGDFLARASKKPWFDDTIFVITADHCASSWGRSALPLNRYHIPLLIYSPKHVAPGRIDRLMSQIDIPPTLLGLLNFSYVSRFYGYDIMKLEPGRERAVFGNYQKAGYLRNGILTVLSPKRQVQQTLPRFDGSGDADPLPAPRAELIDEAVTYYQTASFRFRSGLMVAPAHLLHH